MPRFLFATGILSIVFTSWSLGDPLFRAAADRPVSIEHLALDIEVFLEEKRVVGTASLHLRALRPVRTVRLDGVDLAIREVTVLNNDPDNKPKGAGEGKVEQDPSAQPLPFSQTDQTIDLEFDPPLSRDETRVVTLGYEVREPKSGLHFFGPTEKDPRIPFMVWSQGEPISNRYWFPCLDHPNAKQTTEIRVTVDAGYDAISNGRLVAMTPQEDGRVQFHWLQDQPHVAYLVSLVVGKFHIGKAAWRGRPVLYYVPPERAADLARTFDRTPIMLDYFSERFGVEYPWDKYAQVVVEQFLIGGMENTSATTLVDSVMHDQQALLDSSPDWLIAHELAHQWWGDLVTCKDWAHLWLNEGFATYSESLWAEHHQGTEAMQYKLYQDSGRARSGKALDRPIVDHFYSAPEDMFDSRAYPKGAWVLHMLRSQLGDEDFFGGLRDFLERFAHQSVETADLRQALERRSGRSLERFFYDWTARPGHPELRVVTEYQPAKRQVRIVVRQTQKQDPFVLPLEIELGCYASTQPVTLSTTMESKEETYFLPVPNRPILVRVDPQQTILCVIEEEKPTECWLAQLREGPTVVERIRAAQHLGKTKSTADREALIAALPIEPFYGVRIALCQALADSGGSASRDALIVALDDSDARVRRAAADGLGSFFEDATARDALVDRLARPDPSYAYRAALLATLSKIQREPVLEPLLAALAEDSHRDAIRAAALGGLARSSDPKALEALLEWSRPGHSRSARLAAIPGLARFLNRNDVDRPTQTQVVEQLGQYFDQETPAIRRATVEAFRDLESTAQPVAGVLDMLAQQDPDSRVRELARAARSALHQDRPAAEELARLRREIEELRSQNRELDERIKQVERR